MSCHFHRMRALAAAKAAQEARNATRSDDSIKLDKEPVEGEKLAQEASKAPKKAPKKKGDAK